MPASGGCSPRLPGVWVGRGAALKAQDLLSLCVHTQDAFPAWKGTFTLLPGLRNPGSLAAVGEDLAEPWCGLENRGSPPCPGWAGDGAATAVFPQNEAKWKLVQSCSEGLGSSDELVTALH